MCVHLLKFEIVSVDCQMECTPHTDKPTGVVLAKLLATSGVDRK